jgi:hypothetical protein
MWDGDAISSHLGVLHRGEDGALDLAGTEVRYERSSVIYIEEKLERGGIGGIRGIGGALGGGYHCGAQ